MSKLNADRIIWTDNTLNELRDLLGEIEIEFDEDDVLDSLDFPWPITIKSVGHDEDEGGTQTVYAVISFDAVDGAETYEVRFSPLDPFLPRGIYGYGNATTDITHLQCAMVANDIMAIFRATHVSGTNTIYVRYMDIDAMTMGAETVLHTFSSSYDIDTPHSPYDYTPFKAYELKNGNVMVVINVSQFFIHDESYARIYRWDGSGLVLVSSTTGGGTGFTHRDSTPVNYNFPGWSLGSPNSYEFGNISDTGLWAPMLALYDPDYCVYMTYPGLVPTDLVLPVNKLASSSGGGRYGWQQWVDSKTDPTKTYMLTNDTDVVASDEHLALVKLNVTPSAITVSSTSDVLTNSGIGSFTGVFINSIDVRFDEKVTTTFIKSKFSTTVLEARTMIDVFGKKIAVDFTAPDGFGTNWTGMGTRYAGVVYLSAGKLNWYFISPGEYL
jgi:hypothetical protein